MYVFRVKIRRAANARDTQRVFLWGGKGVTTPMPSSCPLLSVRVDDDGEPVKIVAHGKSEEITLAELGPGEAYTVELANRVGIGAESKADTHVTCVLHDPRT